MDNRKGPPVLAALKAGRTGFYLPSLKHLSSYFVLLSKRPKQNVFELTANDIPGFRR
jgi:hypothetical protein